MYLRTEIYCVHLNLALLITTQNYETKDPCMISTIEFRKYRLRGRNLKIFLGELKVPRIMQIYINIIPYFSKILMFKSSLFENLGEPMSSVDSHMITPLNFGTFEKCPRMYS